jgi:subtilase family serine protease
MPAGADARPLPATTGLPITLTLRPRASASLAELDQELSDPASPLYRHYLTEAQFESEFSPSASNVSAVEDYFTAAGARAFTVTPDRLGVAFVLPAGDTDRAFGTSVADHSVHGRTTLAPIASPHLPAAIAAPLADVSGLGGTVTGPSLELPNLEVAAAPAVSGLGREFLNGTQSLVGTQWFVGSDYVPAYHEEALLPSSTLPFPNATYATDEAVATLMTSSYNGTSQTDLPPWDPTVISAYFNETFPPAWPHPVVQGVPVLIDNQTPPAPGSFGSLTDSSKSEIENSLDLEMAGSVAPGAEVVNFYCSASLTYAPSSSPDSDAANDFALLLASALTHDYGGRRLASVSASIGVPDLNDSLWNTELGHAAATGVSVLASSGDQGDAPDSVSGRDQGQWPTWPATAAFNGSGTIAVGGTTLTLQGGATGVFDGTSAPVVAYDGANGGLISQAAWSDTLAGPSNYSGSEGGISLQYAEPYWQFHSAAQPPISGAAGTEGVVTLGRAEPDVAFAANETIAFVATDPGGQVVAAELEGTSIASPLFAGLLAECAAVAGHPFGYLDPELYRMAGYFAAHPGSSDPFLPVTLGANYVFTASAGWNAVDGWGGLDAERFLAVDGNATVTGYTYTGPTPGLPPPASATSTDLLLAVPIAVALAGVVVLWIALERRASALPAPSNAPKTPPAGTPEGSWFACPYCGAARPSDPVRCPGCGRF